ncbi:MAG: Gfo/Idh/MocA family oxidoreductase [Methylobacteriaceae bacterium]|nr:Gfo/Idh/MocA family oxidoreductase [Methylobacteriaceae bacterium]
MNVCMVGHGMMGTWHSQNLKRMDCRLHTLVGALPEPTAAFAAEHGYVKWTTDYASALRDPEVDVVFVATPSEVHAAQSIAALERGKPVLSEIPIAMNLADAEKVVATARRQDRVLAVCHPRRFGAEREALCQRVHTGSERVRLIDCRFFIHRLSNVGATGIKREWTDNLLWHHVTHLIDFGLWMLTGGELAGADRRIHSVRSSMSVIHQTTGIPMDAALLVETTEDQLFVSTASYHSRAWIYDLLVVTDWDTYRFDELKGTLTTGDGEIAVTPQQEQCAMAARDFFAAVRERREPAVSGASVLPAMRILERAQEEWDRRHGRRSLPGRPLPAG